MRPTVKQLLSLGLLAATLPLATDAGAPVPPASRTPACLTIDAPPPPVDRGDEKFFDIPGGVPNVMILLDTSGSMREVTHPLPFPATWPASGGTCSTELYAPIIPKRTNTPFDNGFNTGLVVDNPPWALAKCTLTPRPTGDNVSDPCMFRGDSYYKFPAESSNPERFIGALSAPKVFNAKPCGAVTSSGAAIKNNLGAQVMAADLAECESCLANAGYYLFRVTYRTSATSTATTTQAVFKGDFFNAYPPKFVAARKVVKDLAKLDPLDPKVTDQIRLGLTIFTANGGDKGLSSSLRSEDGGRLMVPLGPNCDDSAPATQVKFQPARQALINAVNDATVVDFNANTPLAETLFNVGQYFADPSFYKSHFGDSWIRSSFAETSAGLINASWATQAGKKQASICWSCQQSSVVVVSDGEPNNDSNLPKSPTPVASIAFADDFRSWNDPALACAGCGNDFSGSPANTLHKVAYFLANTDLRQGADMAGRQRVAVYTISFGIDEDLDKKAYTILKKTGELGDGDFANTSSGEELGEALNKAVTAVVSKTTAFSSANANSLQTTKTDAADTYVGRFKPNDASIWEGHLFATELFDEFARGCDSRFSTNNQPTITCGNKTNPNLSGNETPDGKAICTDAYLVDRDCDPIFEDPDGTYRKGVLLAATKEFVAGPSLASLTWDAGQVLSDPAMPGYKSAADGTDASRQLWTTIDINGDGLLTAADGTIEFTAANAAALAPSMSLDKATCVTILQAAKLCGEAPFPACPAGASLTSAEQTQCAQVVINYLRGWDVFDGDGDHCAGPGGFENTNPWGSCTNDDACSETRLLPRDGGRGGTCKLGKCVTNACPGGEQRDRINDDRKTSSKQFWKLGDIFHSSPTLIRPPIDKFLCSLGLFTQCALTIYSPQGNEGVPTPLDPAGPGLDAYDLWRQANLTRQQQVLVGANDGMLHAFDAGSPDTSRPVLPDGSRPFTSGSGSEMWGYVPPDILPRLKTMMSSHQYTVDGTTMVRDIWVDLNNDGKKQPNEFRTVAIIQERSGGVRRTALDVTVPAKPVFLWTFPQNCSEDALLAGQSWGEFLPRPPPIGPVRIKPGPGDADPTGRGYLERWVVMLNGGYDPALVRGRAVWMLDAWTGKKVWQYTDADFKAMLGHNKASMFPVPAAIGMTDVGRLDTLVGRSQTDYIFDTATWGDLGGNVFLARFYEPGQRDPSTGLVTNWTAARTFEQQRQADDRQLVAGRSQYFFMTQNIPTHPSGLRVLLGSGNRAGLMDTRPTCGPDDVFGCAQSGCGTVTASSTKNHGAGSCNAALGTFSSTAGVLSFTPGASAGCAGTFTAPGPLESRTDVTASCGTGGSLPPSFARTTCDSAGLPRAAPNNDREFASSLTFVPGLANPCVPNRYVSFWAYGATVAGKRMEENKTTHAIPVSVARSFDGNRFTDVKLSACTGMPDNQCSLVEVSNALVKLDVKGNFTPECLDGATKCKADGADPGWMYTYGKFCPEGPGKCTSSPPWCDERTASPGIGAAGCMIWSSFRPTGAELSSNPCKSAGGTSTSFQYFANALTGIPSKGTDGFGATCGIPNDLTNPTELRRGAARSVHSPPQAPATTIAINSRGEVSRKAQSTDSSGTTSVELGTRSSLVETLYWLEVPRQVHTCRHVDPSSCK